MAQMSKVTGKKDGKLEKTTGAQRLLRQEQRQLYARYRKTREKEPAGSRG